MKRWGARIASCALLLAAGCARSLPPVAAPEPFTEREDYQPPSLEKLDGPAAREVSTAWGEIVHGEPKAAIARLDALLERTPASRPILAARAYAFLRAGDAERAESEFASILKRDEADAASLVGLASIARSRGDVDRALDLYRRARLALPTAPQIERRVLDLQAQRTDQLVGDARRKRSEGRLDDAADAYRRALDAAPELAALRGELADVLVESGRVEDATLLLQEAGPADRLAQLHLARILSEQGDLDGAMGVLEALTRARPGDGEAEAALRDARRARAEAMIPPEVRAIASAPRVTRGELAALLIARVAGLPSGASEVPPVAVDIDGHWGHGAILRALGLRLLEVYPNHTFQPEATVRRGDLAVAVGRVLALMGRETAEPPVAMNDVRPTSLLYPDIVRVVAAGLMGPNPSGAFEPWRPVSGDDAWRVVEELTRLLARNH